VLEASLAKKHSGARVLRQALERIPS
jgi:hypothetical protein